jgi:hypothetical protein
MQVKVYQRFAQLLQARENCKKHGNKEWFEKHDDEINVLINQLPSGSGIDSGNSLDEKSTSEKIIINSSFHKMDENGFYDGWINYRVIITASLSWDFNLNIIGNFGKRQDIKEYLAEIYSNSFSEIAR